MFSQAVGLIRLGSCSSSHLATCTSLSLVSPHTVVSKVPVAPVATAGADPYLSLGFDVLRGYISLFAHIFDRLRPPLGS